MATAGLGWAGAAVAEGTWGRTSFPSARPGPSRPAARATGAGLPGGRRAEGGALRFSLAVHALLKGPPVVAAGFRELGRVDVAVTGGEVLEWVFLNGTPALQAVGFPVADAEDAVPGASAGPPEVIGTGPCRAGGQRFGAAVRLRDGCPGCDVVAMAMRFEDFGPDGRRAEVSEMRVARLDGLARPLRPSTLEIGNRPELMQFALLREGYDAGPVDGRPGPTTRRALMAFQA